MRTIILVAILLATLTPAVTNRAAADDRPDVMMTGTIVGFDGDKLKIQTPNVGVQIFKFDEGVQRPANLAVGTQVTMWVDPDDADDNPPGEQVEKETYTIRRISLTAAEPPKAMATPPPQPQTAPPPRAEEPPVTAPATEPERSELPQTASPLPAIGILGLLAIAGGLTLRMKRHSM